MDKNEAMRQIRRDIDETAASPKRRRNKGQTKGQWWKSKTERRRQRPAVQKLFASWQARADEACQFVAKTITDDVSRQNYVTAYRSRYHQTIRDHIASWG